MKTTSWTSVAVLAIIAVFMVGCNHSSAHGGDGEVSTGDEESMEAEDCDIDSDCSSYYRCIDGRCQTPPAMTGEGGEETPTARFYDGDQNIAEFSMELALTEQQQSRGLMHRPEMLDDWGMLFVYPDEQHLSFWMKNTLISLDMIFIDADGAVVGVVHEAEPETETPRGVGVPSKMVLEVNGGLAEEFGIERGTTVRLEHVEQVHGADR